jgi:four helix bundle protein
LADQLRRAAVSISNNIVEGSTGSKKNFSCYLERAIGSMLETVNIVHFAFLQNYITNEDRNMLYQKGEQLIIKIRSLKKTLT